MLLPRSNIIFHNVAATTLWDQNKHIIFHNVSPEYNVIFIIISDVGDTLCSEKYIAKT